MENKTEIIVKPSASVTVLNEPRMGFEEPIAQEDLIIPRAKLLQPLSPEVSDSSLELKSGDVINSLNKEKLPMVFVPVKKYTEWMKFNPKEESSPNFNPEYKPGAIIWRTKDPSDPRTIEAEFGEKGEKPTALKVLNFLSYFPGHSMPVVISFSKTSYRYGKELFNMAYFGGGSLFSRTYKLVPTLVKDKFTYFVLKAQLVGPTTSENIAIAESWYGQFIKKQVDVHVEDIDAEGVEEHRPY